MSQYPQAFHPADNDSLRPSYGKSIQTLEKIVRNTDRPDSLWILRNTPENISRYQDLFRSNNPPTTEAEALERAGATFFPVCMLYIVQRKPTHLLCTFMF